MSKNAKDTHSHEVTTNLIEVCTISSPNREITVFFYPLKVSNL